MCVMLDFVKKELRYSIHEPHISYIYIYMYKPQILEINTTKIYGFQLTQLVKFLMIV